MATQPRRVSRTEKIRFLTRDALSALFGVIRDRRDRAIFLVAYRHGLRASEVGLLLKTDLDLKRARILVHRVKGSRGGDHPLQPDEAKALKAYLRTRKHDSPALFPSRRGDPISRRTLDWL